MSRRTPEDALVAALTRSLGTLRTLRHTSTDWHSATFSGARHVLSFSIDDDATTVGLLREIAEADLQLGRGFVADIRVTAATAGHDGLTVQLEVLILVE